MLFVYTANNNYNSSHLRLFFKAKYLTDFLTDFEIRYLPASLSHQTACNCEFFPLNAGPRKLEVAFCDVGKFNFSIMNAVCLREELHN